MLPLENVCPDTVLILTAFIVPLKELALPAVDPLL